MTQLTRSEMADYINTQLPTNGRGLVTAARMRALLANMEDSTVLWFDEKVQYANLDPAIIGNSPNTLAAGDDPRFASNMTNCDSQLIFVTTFFQATNKYALVAGYASPGDGGMSVWVRTPTEPSHPGKLRSTDRYLPNGTIDNTNGGWWVLTGNTVKPQVFGANATGAAPAAAFIQDCVDYLEATQISGGFVDCSGGVFSIEAQVRVTNNDIRIGGTQGILASFHRASTYNTGAQFYFQSANVTVSAITRSGLVYCAVRDLGPYGTLGASPYGIIYETANQAAMVSVELFNESFITSGSIGFRPNHIEALFTRPYEAGRMVWYYRGSTIPASIYPHNGACWGDNINLECGVLTAGGTICVPSCDYGILAEDGDGLYLNGIHIQSSQIAHFLGNPTSGVKPLNNIGFTEAFFDICLGKGLWVAGSVPVQSCQFRGVLSSSGFDTAGMGAHITNPIKGFTLDVERLEGWTDGIVINNTVARNGSVTIHQAQNIRAGSAVSVIAGQYITICPKNINGLTSGGAIGLTSNGAYLGANAVQIMISGGQITGCDTGIVIDTGANVSGVAGVDIRGNTTAITNAGTATSAKSNLGAADI